MMIEESQRNKRRVETAILDNGGLVPSSCSSLYYLCFVFVAFFMCSVEFVPGNVEKVVKTDDSRLVRFGTVVSIFIANHPKMPIALHLTHNKTYA